jgi:PAS domain S-box-containing protein
MGIHMRSTETVHEKFRRPDGAGSEPEPHINQQELLLAQVSQAFSLSLAAALWAVTSGLIVAIALRNVVSHAYLLVWLTGFLALYASRQALAWAFHRASPSSSEILPWAKWYFVAAIAIGLWWGLTGVLLFPPDSVLHKSVLAIFIAAAACVAAVHLMPTTAYLPVILAMLLPLSGRFLYQGDNAHVTVGILILMYAVVLVLMGRRMHAINTESFILRFENTDLVHSLREQKTELKAQIEERIRLEEAILRDEEKYRQLAENVGDVLMLIRSAEPYSFIYVSPAYQKMIGRDVQELYENPAAWLTDVHEEDRSQVADSFKQFIQGAGDFNHEFRMLGPSGPARWMWATGFPIKDAQGGIYRFAVIARDITQRKSDEERLKHLVKEIKDFAYIISHDFRTPLINMQGFAGELESSMAAIKPAVQMGLGHLEENQKSQTLTALEQDIPEALGFINSSVFRMNALIKVILDLSRLERRQLHLESLNMDELVAETVKSLSYQLEEASTKVSVRELPQTIADRLAMEQIVTNLLSNAIKFRDPERPQEIIIAGHRLPHETVFVVQDQGRGVDLAYLSKIFQVFHRGSIKGIPGEGIGLAHVRTLLRRHGGRIWCESSPGEGSTFTFTISNHLLSEGATRSA